MKPGQIRLIGGRWRGRRIPVPEAPGQSLRPTPDRVRETLFNWLSPWVVGSRCLDLFCGTGALGLEALSRGAAVTTFVERDAGVARHLRAQLDRLEATGAEVIEGDALQVLAALRVPAPYDVVFVDPPYEADVVSQVLCALRRPGLLAADARVYVEAAVALEPAELAPDWIVTRAKRAGQVRYHLLALAD